MDTDTQHFWSTVASPQSQLRSQSPEPTTSQTSAQSMPSWPQPQASLPLQLTPEAISQLQPSLSPGTATLWPSLVLPMPPASDTSSLLSVSRSLTRSEAKSSCASRARFLSEMRPSSGDSGRPKIGRCFVNTTTNNNNNNNSSSNNNNGNNGNDGSNKSNSGNKSNSSNNNNNSNNSNNDSSINRITFRTGGTQQDAVRRCRSEAPQSAIASRPAPFGTAVSPPPRPPRAYGHPLTAAAAAEVTWRGRRKNPSSHDAQPPTLAQRQVATTAPCSPGWGSLADPKIAHEGGQELSSYPGSGAGCKNPKSPSSASASPPSSIAPLQAVTAPLPSDYGASEVSPVPATMTALVTTTAAALGSNNATAFNATAPAIAPPTAALSTCSSASPAAATTTAATAVAISAVCRTSSLCAEQAAPMLVPFRGCKCWQAGICTNAPCSINYLCDTRIAIRRAGLFRDTPEPPETLHLGRLALCSSSPPLADPNRVEYAGAMPPSPSNGAMGFPCRFREAGLYGSTPYSTQQVCDKQVCFFQKKHHYQLQQRADSPSELSLSSGTTAAGDATISTVSTSTTSASSAATFATTGTNTSITLMGSGGESPEDSRDSAIVLSSTGQRRNEKTMTSEEGGGKMPLPAVSAVWFRTAALICAKDHAAASSQRLAVGSLATARRSHSMSMSGSEYRMSTGSATYTTRRLLDAELGRAPSQQGSQLALQQPSNKPEVNAPGCKATTAVSGRWRTGECTEDHVNNRREFNLGTGQRQAPIVWGMERGTVTGSMRGGSQLSLPSKGCKSHQASLDKTGSSPLAAEPLRLPLVGAAQQLVAPAMRSAHAAHAVVVVMLVAGVNERRSGVPKEALEEADAAAAMVAAVAAGDPGQMAGAVVCRAVPTMHQVRTYVSLAHALPDLRRSVGSAGGCRGAITADSIDVWWVQYNAAFVPADE
ncbi:hypothetical protein Vafri_3452 [Volvox africanus]|nr:hypothetical protein Vafri_3452 [Volvox africanus]